MAPLENVTHLPGVLRSAGRLSAVVSGVCRKRANKVCSCWCPNQKSVFITDLLDRCDVSSRLESQLHIWLISEAQSLLTFCPVPGDARTGSPRARSIQDHTQLSFIHLLLQTPSLAHGYVSVWNTSLLFTSEVTVT